jgi:hypothetical protein
MTDYQPEPLTAERAAEIEAEVQLEAELANPIRLAIRFKITGGINIADPVLGEMPGVVLTYQTPCGTQRIVLTRDEAIAIGSQLRKAAHGGLSTPEGN